MIAAGEMGSFWFRAKGKEGVARLFYCTLVDKQIVILHAFIKKAQETSRKELKIAIWRMKEIKNENS